MSTQQLIDNFTQAQRNRANARRCVVWTNVLIIGIFIALITFSFRNFANKKIEAFNVALTTELAAIAPRNMEGLLKSVEPLYNTYHAEFVKMLERDKEMIQAEVNKEMMLFDKYVQERWPKIQAGIASMVVEKEQLIRDEVSKFLNAEEAEEIAAAYGLAIRNKSEFFLLTTIKDHKEVAEEIGASLEKIMEKEGDIDKPVNVLEMLGIMLEVIGIELQQSFYTLGK